MNNLSSLGLLALSLGTVMVGCSSSSSGSDPFGPDPDYAAVQQRFDAPSGTVSDRNLGALFKQFGDQRSSTSMTDVSGATALGGSASDSTSSSTPPSNGGTYSKALRILDLTTRSNSTSSSCSALAAGNLAGNCACPGGGSYDYDFSSFQALRQASTGPLDASLKVRFTSCSYGAASIDGREFVHVHAARNGSTLDESSLSMIMIADFAVVAGGQTHTVDLAAEIDSKSFALALQVDDGWVTIRATTSGASGAGSFVIRDRNGSWTCDVANGSGTCKDASGASHKF